MSENHKPVSSSTPRLVKGNGWIAFGLLLVVVTVMLALAQVSVGPKAGQTSCGSWLSKSSPQDRESATQCDDAQSQRTWMVLTPAVLAVLCIGGGVVLRNRDRRV